MEQNIVNKYLDTFRRIYFDGYYGTEKGNKTLERKAKILKIDTEEVQSIINELLEKYNEFQDILFDFLEDGELTENQKIEIEEFKTDLELNDEEVTHITKLVYKKLDLSNDNSSKCDNIDSTNEIPDNNIDNSSETNMLENNTEETNLCVIENDEKEDSNMLKLNINGIDKKIEFYAPMTNDWLYYKFSSSYFEIENNFISTYKKFSSLENMLNKIDDVFVSQLFCYADLVINELRNDNILEYCNEDIVKAAYENQGEYFESIKDEAFDFLQLIDGNSANTDAYRTARRKSRGKFVGFGTEGMVKAGAANMATGAVHGAFNLIGKGISSASNSIKKSNKLKEMQKKFVTGLYILCEEMYNIMAQIYKNIDIACDIAKNIEERENKSKAIIENCAQLNYNDDQLFNAVSESLSYSFYTNDTAFEMLIKLCIKEDAAHLDANLYNINRISNFTKDNTLIDLSNNTLIDDMYIVLINQAINSAYNDETIEEILRKIDTYFYWNEHKHEDLKEEIAYRNPSNEYVKSNSKVEGAIGSAFIDYAMNKYTPYANGYFGNSFLSMNDNKIGNKIINAGNSYARDYDVNERVIFLYDDTLMGSGKSGFFISEKYIYGKGINKIKLDELKTIDFSVSVGVTYISFNGSKTLSLTMLDKGKLPEFKTFICSIFPSIENNFNENLAFDNEFTNESYNKTENYTQNESYNNNQFTDNSTSYENTSNEFYEVNNTYENCSTNNCYNETAPSININESLKTAYYNIHGKSILGYIYLNDGSNQCMSKFYNAINAYAPITKDEQPLLLFDNTAFGSAKDGFLITNKNMYAHNMWAERWYIPLNQISFIGCSGTSLMVNNFKAEINMISKKEREEFRLFIEQIINMIKRTI